MARITLTGLLVLVVMFVVPLPFYAGFSAVGWVSLPAPEAPGAFMLGVLVTKIGVAATFVLLFRWACTSTSVTWPMYASAWLVLFMLGEVGQAIAPGYGWGEAAAGMLSEALYVPLSAYAAARLMQPRVAAERAGGR